MQNLLYEDAINKLSEMKNNKIIEKQIMEINEILFLNGLNQDEDFTIASRYKSEESIEEKLSRKSYKYLDQLTDLAGIKIVFKDLNITMKACEIFRNNLEIIKEDDYYKDKRNTGYKSIHFNLEDSNKNIIELQVKDKINDLKQDYCHSNIYKNNLIADEYKDELNEHMNKFVEEFYNQNIKNEFNLFYKINEKEETYFNIELRENVKSFESRKITPEKDKMFKEKINLNDLELLARNRRQSQPIINLEEDSINMLVAKNER